MRKYSVGIVILILGLSMGTLSLAARGGRPPKPTKYENRGDIPRGAVLLGATSFVPATRTINGQALTGNVYLTPSDVGAIALDGSNDMTGGELTLFGNPTGNLSAVPKQYIDSFPVGNANTVDTFDTSTTTTAHTVVVRKYDGTIAGIGAGLTSARIILSNTQSSGTDGGTATSGAWYTLTINTENVDTGGDAAILTNNTTFTLTSGTYNLIGSAPFYKCDSAKTRLYNQTDSAVLVSGTSEYANAANNGSAKSLMFGRFVLGATKRVKVQYYVSNTRATDGLGKAVTAASTSEVYTVLDFEKE